MKTELQPGEKIVRQGPANLQKNVETVGGLVIPDDKPTRL
jgi:hypothetical protein